MICHKCSHKLLPNARFCNQCGAKAEAMAPTKAVTPSGLEFLLGCIVAIGYVLFAIAVVALAIYGFIDLFPITLALMAIALLLAIIVHFLPKGIKDKLAKYEKLRPYLDRGNHDR
jgi:hypothetical protein